MTECPPIALMCVGNPLYTPLKLSWPSKLKSGHSPFQASVASLPPRGCQKVDGGGREVPFLGGSKIGEELGTSDPNSLLWQPTGLGSNLRLQYNSKPPGESTSASKLLPTLVELQIQNACFACWAVKIVRPSSVRRPSLNSADRRQGWLLDSYSSITRSTTVCS